MSNIHKLLNIYNNKIFCYNIKKLEFLKYKIRKFVLILKYKSSDIKITYFRVFIYKNLYNKKNNYIIRYGIIILY